MSELNVDYNYKIKMNKTSIKPQEIEIEYDSDY